MLELIGSHAVRLNVPKGIHDVFHVNLLRRAAEDPLPSQQLENIEPPALLIDGSEEYEVEKICRHRRRGRGWQVLVRWRGYVEPTWEPVRDLADTAALEAYEGTISSVPWRPMLEESGRGRGSAREEEGGGG